MQNKRFYNFGVVIYEDDERFDSQAFNLAQESECIYIRHDQDIFEKDVTDDDGNVVHTAGESKKPHFHYVLKLKNACTISALAKRIDVDEYMIEPIKKSFNEALKYLIHYGYDNKYQYDPSEVKSNSDKLMRKFTDLVTKEVPEVDKVISIQEFIESNIDYVDISILGKYAQKNNLWDVFRRNFSYFCKLCDYHNGRISALKYHQDTTYYDTQRKNEHIYDE